MRALILNTDELGNLGCTVNLARQTRLDIGAAVCLLLLVAACDLATS